MLHVFYCNKNVKKIQTKSRQETLLHPLLINLKKRNKNFKLELKKIVTTEPWRKEEFNLNKATF